VFVDAVKRNQIGVHPSESFLASTAPGTIPASVRPPRIPELANAPASQGVAHPTGEVSPPQMAIADTGSTESQSASKPFGFFSSLFGPKTETKPAETKTVEVKPAGKKPGAIDRMARMVGLRKDDPKTSDAKTAEANKPAAKPVQATSNGAIRPKPAETPAVKTAEAHAPQPAPAAAPSPWPAVPTPQRAAAPAAPAANNGAITGGAPVTPTGNFDNRWSGFR
jgi:hypothetical protein